MMLLAASEQASRGGAHGPGFLFPLLLILLLSLLMAKMIRRGGFDGLRGRFDGPQSRHHSHSHSRYGSSMQTLHERFARGEIDQAEFEHRKAVLDRAEYIPPAPPGGPAPAQDAPTDTPEWTAPKAEYSDVDSPAPDDEQ